tara:strand:- start:437 stop:811 length:375 start_codon:yes stop_codon:yes gene_type:complete
MTIFDILNSLFYNKKKIEITCDNENVFSLFMVNRWMSMYSPELLKIINETSNQYWGIFETSRETYAWLYALFPRLRFKRVVYIKKKKKASNSAEEKERDGLITTIATSHELSQREVRMYMDMFS